ncbi:MAG TPA: histidine kinase dimerization/phospho-acceptor domain-containing protein, partial [bacterium]|nr:histidine kinase dimerization/phospho-acceptor domain-containing protein [bacterium]
MLISVMLVLALGLAGLLAFNAQATFRDHRKTAERVLQDYARLAAARFAQRTAQNLYYMACWPVVEAFARSGAADHPHKLPAPAAIAGGLDSVSAAFVRHARYSFRLDLASGKLTSAGGQPSPAVRRWLRDTIPGHISAVYMKEEHVAALVDSVDGKTRLVVYTVAKPDRAGAKPVVLGVDIDPLAMVPFYTMSAEKFPLLPRPLTGGVIYDSLGSLEVTDLGGRELYHSPVRYEPMFTGRDTMEAMMAGLPVQVTLRPDIANKLVIGGLPRSHLPFVLGVLLLTAGLIVTALVQLRRETELARLRTDFVSGVSHELRTPLAQIRMFGETLLLGRVRSDTERRRSLEIIDQEARRLTHLVENLLHFSRSERQAHRVAPEPTWMAPLVRSIVEAFAPLAVPRRVRLRADIAE